LNYTNQFRFANETTIINNIHLFRDSLLLTGEVGVDSSGVSGILVATMDTNGIFGNIAVFRDPSGADNLLLSGNSPVLINEHSHIILAGTLLSKDDLFILSIDPNLNLIFYTEYQSQFRSMYIDGFIEMFDSYYAVGTVQTQSNDLNIFVQKIAADGNSIWMKTYGNPDRDESGFSVILDFDGLTVRAVKHYNPTPSIKNDTRYWTQFMHIDTSGAVKWIWEEEVTGEEGYGDAFVKYGTDYIYTTNFLGDEYNAGILQAAQLVRRDSAFNLVWRKVYGEPNNFYNGFGDIIMSSDSHILLAGQILDDSEDFNWARVMKICPNGEIVCEIRDTGYVLPNGESLNRMEGIVESPSGSIYAVGYTNRSLFLYDGLILKVNLDGCIDTLCTITDIEDHIRLQEDLVLLYPNPVRSALQISISENVSLPVLVSVHDVHGRQLHKTWIHQHSASVDLSGLVSGPYYVVTEKNGSILHAQTIVKLE
jgi:hypothetical protein